MTTQAPRLGQRECPVREGTPNHCKATTRPGHLMCGRHWSEVPSDLRAEVWRTWKAWQRTMTEPRWDAYMIARNAALDHFTREDAERAATPSAGLTWDDLDGATLVLVVAPDGSSRMWFGGDRDAAGYVLRKVWADLATQTDAVADERPS